MKKKKLMEEMETQSKKMEGMAKVISDMQLNFVGMLNDNASLRADIKLLSEENARLRDINKRLQKEAAEVVENTNDVIQHTSEVIAQMDEKLTEVELAYDAPGDIVSGNNNVF